MWSEEKTKETRSQIGDPAAVNSTARDRDRGPAQSAGL